MKKLKPDEFDDTIGIAKKLNEVIDEIEGISCWIIDREKRMKEARKTLKKEGLYNDTKDLLKEIAIIKKDLKDERK